MKHSCVGSLLGLLFLLTAVVTVASGSAWSVLWFALALLYLWQPDLSALRTPQLVISRDRLLAAGCLIVAASYYALMVLR